MTKDLRLPGGVSELIHLLAAASHIYVACLAAAKTIINEIKQDLPEESPILWTTQAFSVAAAVSMFSLLSYAKSLTNARLFCLWTISTATNHLANTKNISC
jgi:hypothetical protein